MNLEIFLKKYLIDEMPNKKNEISDNIQKSLQRLLSKKTGKNSYSWYAIGLDMASKEGNCGLCVLGLNKTLDKATILDLYPRPKINNDFNLAKKNLERPTNSILKNLLKSKKDTNCPLAMGVDVQFGWPIGFSEFVKDWKASEGRENTFETDSFIYRLTDEKISNLTGNNVLSVSSDKIARCAFAWAKTRKYLQNEDINFFIDLGLDHGVSKKNKLPSFFECYPGAFIKHLYGEFDGYKSDIEKRKLLLKKLLEKYNIKKDKSNFLWLIWSLYQGKKTKDGGVGGGGSCDAFDSFLWALNAWEYLKWVNNPTGAPITTPGKLLGMSVNNLDIEKIKKEGWILIPTR